MHLVWAGLACGMISAWLLYLSKRSEERASHMSGTETSRISDVQRLVTEVAADLPGKGATGFTQYSELKGTLRCDTPVEAELSESRVAMYETLIEREIETRYEERDADGNRRVRWRRSTEVMSRNHRAAPFYLDDGSGRVRVAPEGAIKHEKYRNFFAMQNAYSSRKAAGLYSIPPGIAVGMPEGLLLPLKVGKEIR